MKPLLAEINRMRDTLPDLHNTARTLSQAPKLGSHPYGDTVAVHDQKSAAGESNSVSAVLQQFDQVLAMAGEALERASGQYRETEQAQADLMKSVNQWT